MCAPSPPSPPDYTGAAQAQGTANLEAARATAKLNNPNIVSPFGTQTVTYGSSGPTFDETGYKSAQQSYLDQLQRYNSTISDPEAPRGVAPLAPDATAFWNRGGDQDMPTVTQTLSPEQQAIFNKTQQIKSTLGDVGLQGAGSLGKVIGQNLDLSGAPRVPGDASSTRNAVINAMMSRVDEDTGKARDQKNSDLVAAGIRPGSKAYDDQMQVINRGYNDARSQALLAGGQEASRDFGIDTQRRKDAIAEILASRQTPLNEINALMSGSQISNPFASPGSSGANVQPAPIANAAGQQSAFNTDLYNAKVGQANSQMQTGVSAATLAAMFMASDRRLKSNIVRIGEHPLGIGIYEYDIFGKRDIGVMADEVLAVKPECVVVMPNGYMAVNYGALGNG